MAYCDKCDHCRKVTLEGEHIRSYRISRGLGLRELARHAEVSPSFLSDIERGNRRVTNEKGSAGLRIWQAISKHGN